MHDTLERVQSIFRDVFDDDALAITSESSAYTIDGWDSFTHINLISSIEKEFKIKFKLGDLQQLKNVGDMVALMDQMLSHA